MDLQNRFPALDGLRAFAVSFVLLAHAGCVYPKQGGVGVDIFFVLSGFLITGILQRGPRLRDFYARRFLRLAPALVVNCLLFILVCLGIGQTIPWKAVLVTLTYSGNYVLALTDINLSALGPCWSLACEEQFYLIWPFAVYLLEHCVDRRLTKGLTLLTLAALLAFYRELLVSHVASQRIYYGLDTHADGLVLGAALSYLWREIPRGWTKYAVPFCFAVFLSLTAKYGLFSPFMGRWGFFLCAIAAAVVILDLTNEHSPYAVLFSWPPLVYIGKISYGLYLFHMPVYLALEHISPRMPLIVKLATAFAVAGLSYDFIEAPFLKLKKRFA